MRTFIKTFQYVHKKLFLDGVCLLSNPRTQEQEQQTADQEAYEARQHFYDVIMHDKCLRCIEANVGTIVN